VPVTASSPRPGPPRRSGRGGGGARAGGGGPPAPAARLYVRIEAVTPLEQGMTDTQLDGYLAWATFLVDRCAVAFENTLPLTRVRKED